MTLDKELEKEFAKLTEQDGWNGLDFWSRKINPKVVGKQKVKRAILITVASENDRFGDRGRCHLLMDGEPETAKSTLMMWLGHKLNYEFASHRTSEVGLTGDMSGDEIDMGVLPKANGEVVAIDELDKFKKKDRQGLLEAMSDGEVTLRGGGKEQQLQAEVRCIGGCNRTDNFSPELLSRFDWHFKLKKPDKDKTKDILDDRIDNFFREKDNYDGHDLHNYLQYIKHFQPRMSDEVRAKFKKLKDLFVEYVEEETSPRSGEAIIRVTFAIAKLNHRDVHEKDILRAMIELGTSETLEQDNEYKYIQKFGNMLNNGYLSENLKELIAEVFRDMLDRGYITDNERDQLRSALDKTGYTEEEEDE